MNIAHESSYRKIAVLLTPVVRAAARMSPSRRAARAILDRIFFPYLGWREFETIATTGDGLRMHVRFPDMIQTYIYLFGCWEPAATQWLKSRLRPGDVFVDIGANVGYFSLLAAKLVGPSGKVIAIEASPTTAGELEKNVRLNGLGDQIAVICAAVSDCEKSVDMFRAPPSNLGASTIVSAVAQRKGHSFEATVRAFPLPALIDIKQLRRARLIKVDVEGAEAAVFDGVRQCLPELKEAEWIFEFTPQALQEQGRDASDVLRIFTESGYRLYRIENSYSLDAYLRPAKRILEELTTVPTSQVDVIATRRESDRYVYF